MRSFAPDEAAAGQPTGCRRRVNSARLLLIINITTTTTTTTITNVILHYTNYDILCYDMQCYAM